ncbi:MAG: NUDIX domain-containing protein [Bacteroidetes bacterium]|nr:NUDIX domain-containing protein [Bacteroidota bacterium]
MYKVFVNNQSIHFVKTINIHLFDSEDIEFYQFQSKKALLAVIADFIDKKLTQRLYIYCPVNLTEVFSFFKAQYIEIKAGGGLVCNAEDKYLFIFRRGKWDLPKGKMEKGESIKTTAIREIEEETGMDNLTVIKKLPDTFHIYIEKNKNIIKHCYWFLMKTDSKKILKPQIKEDITKAVWLKKEEIIDTISNTYSSISHLVCSYLKIVN